MWSSSLTDSALKGKPDNQVVDYSSRMSNLSDLLDVTTKPMIFDSFYVSLLSEEFKTGNKNFITVFIIGLISNLIGVITKRGHSSTIYVFKKNN